jgi:hypothetical protein
MKEPFEMSESMNPERLRIQMPSMPWPYGDGSHTIVIHSKHNYVSKSPYAKAEVLYEVAPVDHIRYRKAVEKIAYFFRREFGYDFPPYTATENTDADIDGTNPSVVFMWLGRDVDWSGNKKAIAYGACGFGRDFNDKHRWCLSWVWFHPYERRRQHLSNAWPYFHERFGAFSIDTPLSLEMQVFLKKNGNPKRLVPISTWENYRSVKR